MNEQASKWGLTSTNFMNASGLHHENHYSSARDMAIIGKKLVEIGGDLLFSYTTLYDSYVRENTDASVWLVNTNKLLRTLDGTDGLKTGYTSQAGYCITLTTQRDGVRLIGVVMKEPTNKIRDSEIRKLMEYGFSQIQTKPLYTKGDLYETINIEDGKPNELTVLINDDLNIKYINNSDYTPVVTYSTTSAPIMEGEVIGKLQINSNDGLLSETSLIAGNTIEKLEYFDYVKKLFKMFIY
ncbi:MAG: D-alanyl-D-alanine carboxypeptidase [Erysipelotrichales bacterium]|nr:D-alanyl-D-alanine carboxypeptidase [Erysipelotrichales bacterium]